MAPDEAAWFGPSVASVLAVVGLAYSGSVAGFIAARFALGIGEAGNFPASIKVVAEWFPKRERAFATGIFNSGTNIGAVVAPLVVPYITYTWGWYWAFIATGALGFLWLGAWWFSYSAPDTHPRVSASELAYIRSDPPDPVVKIPWATLLRYRQTWAFVSAKFLTDPVWWFFLIWLPDFFKKTRGLDIKHSWVLLVTIYSIVTALSIAGGWLPGHLVRRGYTQSKARKASMFVFAGLVLPILLVTQVGDWSAVSLIGLAGAAHQAWSANLFTSVSDVFPKRAVASIVGIGGMAGSLGGILFPLYSGKLLDRFQASGNVTAGYAVLFGICGSAYLVAFAVNHALAPRFEPLRIVNP
jgi:ACS family hexuronate transporter-like MFS transporter